MTKHEEIRYDDRLMCAVKSLSYDFLKRSGELHVPDIDATHMPGVIDRFLAIDSEAEDIYVYQGDTLDVIYNCQRRRSREP